MITNINKISNYPFRFHRGSLIILMKGGNPKMTIANAATNWHLSSGIGLCDRVGGDFVSTCTRNLLL